MTLPCDAQINVVLSESDAAFEEAGNQINAQNGAVPEDNAKEGVWAGVEGEHGDSEAIKTAVLDDEE